jgi:hypothetical protein
MDHLMTFSSKSLFKFENKWGVSMGKKTYNTKLVLGIPFKCLKDRRID